MNKPSSESRLEKNIDINAQSPSHSVIASTRGHATDLLSGDKTVLDSLNKSETFQFLTSNSNDLKSNSARAWNDILGEVTKALGKSETLALLPQIKEWATQKGIRNLSTVASKFNPNAVSEIDMDDPDQVKNAYDHLKDTLSQIEELELKNKRLSDDMRKTGDLDLSQYLDENLDSIRSLIAPYTSTEEAREAFGNLKNTLEDFGYELKE